MNKRNVEESVSDEFKADGLFECEENEFLDPTLIDESYEQIATCSHLSIFMKFNDENLNGAIVLNKMTNNAFEVKGEQINYYLQKIEECDFNPNEKNIGRGKKIKVSAHTIRQIG